MRKTLHEYVIDRSQPKPIDELILYMAKCHQEVVKYAKLTNRPPKLGDFIPCDEDGNILKEPEQYLDSSINDDWSKGKKKQFQAAKDRVIFKGDWDVTTKNDTSTWIELDDFMELCFKSDGQCRFYGKTITRIEDLPREIEFIDNLI